MEGAGVEASRAEGAMGLKEIVGPPCLRRMGLGGSPLPQVPASVVPAPSGVRRREVPGRC